MIQSLGACSRLEFSSKSAFLFFCVFTMGISPRVPSSPTDVLIVQIEYDFRLTSFHFKNA